MKQIAAYVVATFLLAACSGPSYTWQNPSKTDDTVLRSDKHQCNRLAKNEAPTHYAPRGYRSGARPYGALAGEAYKDQIQVFDGCMIDRGWEKTKVKESA